jgi:hypothetical protein
MTVGKRIGGEVFSVYFEMAKSDSNIEKLLYSFLLGLREKDTLNN